MNDDGDADSIEVLVSGLAFAEGLRYLDDRLWFSDMYDRKVYTVDAQSGEPIRIVDTDDRPSGIVIADDGRAFVTQQISRATVEITGDGTVVPHADLSTVAEWHVNDATAAPSGGLYVGNYGDDSVPPAAPRPARLAHVSPDGTVTEVASDLHFANGMGMTDSDQTLLVAETRSIPPRISAFDIGPDAVLSNRRVFAEFDGTRMPDGIMVLPGGELLVAMPFASEVVLVSAHGEVTNAWSTSAYGMPFAVAFDPLAPCAFAACSSSWEEETCLTARDSTILKIPLR